MTGAEFQAARRKLGVTGAELASALDVSVRTLRGWEAGVRAGRKVEVPRVVAILVRRALKDASFRRELGLNVRTKISEGGGEAPAP